MLNSGMVTGLALLWAAQAAATTVIVPGANARAESSYNANAPFGNGSTGAFVTQIAYAATQLSSVAPGTMITGIGFRIFSYYQNNDQDLNYTSFNIQIGKSANTIAGLDRTFANNLGDDTTTARSGALSIAAGTFIGDRRINPFYTIAFTTPYAYQGGDLLVTIRDSLAADTRGAYMPLDAVLPDASIGGVAIGGSADATKGAGNFFFVPVTQLTVASTTVPEPASWTLMIAGFGLVGGTLRRRAVARAGIG